MYIVSVFEQDESCMQYSYNVWTSAAETSSNSQRKNVLIQSVGTGGRGIPFSPLLTASAGFCIIKYSFS